MVIDKRQALYAALNRILRPLVRILLRNGISYGSFSDFVKWLFVDVALHEFAISGRKQSVSRVSIITGLNRKEVKRHYEQPGPDDQLSFERYNRAARVIAGWRRDKAFWDEKGNPADLPITGPGADFRELVRRYSGDMPFRALLDELLRVGAVTRTKADRIKLLARAYLPEKDATMKIHILGTDVGHLISTIGHNLESAEQDSFLQRKVMYNNIPDEVLPEFRKFSSQEAQSLLEKLDHSLSRQDRDVNPTVRGSGRNVAGVGIYYFEESFPEEK